MRSGGTRETDEREPFSRHRLLRSSDVGEAQRVGTRLITENRLRLAHEHSLAARINGVCMNTVSLYYLKYGTQLTVDSAPLDDCFALLLPLNGAMDVQHGGQKFELTPGRVAGMISPNVDLRMRWNPELAMFCLVVDQRTLREFARCFTRNEDDRALTFETVMNRPAAVQAMLAMARVVQDIFERPEADPGLNPLVSAQLREQLMTTLLMTHTSTYTEMLFEQPTTISQRAVRQAMEIIEADPGSAPTVSSIARRVGISARSLQLGFQRELDQTPAQYMREVRLARARAELLASDPADGKTVMEIAMRWGFTHTSRFAQRYQKRYDETPSATLRR